MAMNPPQAKASLRRRLRRNWTRQSTVELIRTAMCASMWRAPLPKTPTQRANDLKVQTAASSRVFNRGYDDKLGF